MQLSTVRSKLYALCASAVLLLLIPMKTKAQTTKLKDNVPDGKYIGTILNIDFFEGSSNLPIYETTILDQFNAVVAENNHKMSFMMPNEPTDLYNFTIDDLNKAYLDKMISFGDDTMVRRGHALIWYSQAPMWLLDKTVNASGAEKLTKQQIYDFAEQYITVVVNYTKGKLDEWDVFNEAIKDGGGSFRRGTWYDNVGPTDQDIQDFMDHCFQVARAADVNNEVEFFYNDYFVEFFDNNPTSKNGILLSMAKGMAERNVGLDGIGLQSHFQSGGVNILGLEATMNKIIENDLICNITELDIRICSATKFNPTAQELEQQANDYKGVLAMALGKTGCTGLVMWGFTDKHSWINLPQFFPECGSATIYDTNYAIKPAYTSALEGLIAAGNPPVIGGGTQTPFNATPYIITTAAPVIIEFEDFDNGGNTVGYVDGTIGNIANNKTYRPGEDVDVFTDESEITPGLKITGIAYTSVGEWTEYSIDVATAGTYDFEFITTSNSTSTISIQVDEVTLNASIALPNTGGFTPEDYTSTFAKGIELSAGEHRLRISTESNYANMDKIIIRHDELSITTFSASDNLKLYPNPFTEQLFISFNTMENTKTIALVDLQGRTVYKTAYDGSKTFVLKPTNISKGMYFLKITNKNDDQKLVRVLLE